MTWVGSCLHNSTVQNTSSRIRDYPQPAWVEISVPDPSSFSFSFLPDQTSYTSTWILSLVGIVIARVTVTSLPVQRQNKLYQLRRHHYRGIAILYRVHCYRYWGSNELYRFHRYCYWGRTKKLLVTLLPLLKVQPPGGQLPQKQQPQEQLPRDIN